MNESILFIVDCSENIKNYVEDYVKSINDILNVQRSINPNTLITFVTVNTKSNYLCVNRNLSSLEEIKVGDIQPSGILSLCDVGSAVLYDSFNFFDRMYTSSSLVIILSDSNEVSKYLTSYHLSLQIDVAKKRCYKFLFLGLSEESVKFGYDIGCNLSLYYNRSVSKKDCDIVIEILKKLLRGQPYVQDDLIEDLERLQLDK